MSSHLLALLGIVSSKETFDSGLMRVGGVEECELYCQWALKK